MLQYCILRCAWLIICLTRYNLSDYAYKSCRIEYSFRWKWCLPSSSKEYVKHFQILQYCILRRAWLIICLTRYNLSDYLPIIELAMCVYMYVCMYVSHVLDSKLLEPVMSPSPKSHVMLASAFSWIGDFFRIFGIHIFQVMASLLNLV